MKDFFFIEYFFIGEKQTIFLNENRSFSLLTSRI